MSTKGQTQTALDVPAGSGLYREQELRVIEKYKIETLRHAANAIFNKLTEAYSCGTETEQGKQALFDAQALADVIVASPAASAEIGPNTKLGCAERHP